MKRRMVTTVSFMILALTGCSQQEEEGAGKVIPVKVYKVASESISQYIRATGSVTADNDVILYSKIAERVEKINVDPGDAVIRNQVLVEQTNDILRQGLEIANATLKTAEAQAHLAGNDYERMRKLSSEKAISPQQFDQAKMAKETAEHSLERAKSMYAQAKEQYENSFTKAPFDGVAAAVYVELNQTINIGQPVVQLISQSRMKAKIHLTGEDVLHVKTGQNVLIRFPAIPDEEFNGRVDHINTAIDQTSKTLEVEIGFLSKDHRIKSGMFGEFYIETRLIPNSLVIPEPALIQQTELKIDRETGLQSTIKKYYLFVVANNTATMKEVKTGIANNGQIEITTGLRVGDSVIVVGQNIVKDGAAVHVIE